MSELVDIRDERGRLTGETMARIQAHRSEALHGVALVWVYNSAGQILLQRRAAHLNAFPEKLDVTVSGHLTAGDDPLAAAVRETREELGLVVDPSDLVLAEELIDVFPLAYGKQHHEYDYIFVLKKDVETDKLKLQAAEVLDVVWVTPDELEADLNDSVLVHHYTGRQRQIFDIAIGVARQQQARSL